MKIIVKTIKGEQFEVSDINEDTTVLQIKEKIQEIKGHDKNLQKLVFKGKPIDNELTAKAAGIEDNNFLIIIVSQLKKAVNPQPQQVQQEQKVEQKPADKPAEENIQIEEPPKIQPTVQKEEPKEDTQAVENLVAMGFPKDKCQQALKAAFGNQDRAVEYLINGNIPSTNFSQPPPQQIPSQQGGQQEPQGDLSNNPLAELANNPMFQQLRATIQQNPALLQPILSSIAQSNPQLFQVIQQNEQAFMELLQGGGGQQGGGQQPQQQQPGQIMVTPAENEAIERIISLGFDKRDVLEAYLACDKNEELAVNYLLENKDNTLSRHIEEEEMKAAKEQSQNKPEDKPDDKKE